MISLLAAVFAAPSHVLVAADVVVETLLTGLRSPGGVAIRPAESNDRYEIFVAESGAGRVIRIWNYEPNSPSDVITGFPLTSLGESGIRVGPIGLLFIDQSHLIVGASGSDSARVALFELPDQPESISFEQEKQQIELGTNGRTRNHIYAFARTCANNAVPDAIMITCFADDHTGEVRKLSLREGILGDTQPIGAFGNEAKPTIPAAIAVADSGFVVVSWVGSLEVPHDSRLTFINPTNGSRSMELSTDLNDVVGLAYSPKSGNLYAADVAWMNADVGGVFRIDDASEPGTPKCKTVRIADVLQPSALAFGPDGALYVTAMGESSDVTADDGKLLRITGEL
jgi:hypothetical protein